MTSPNLADPKLYINREQSNDGRRTLATAELAVAELTPHPEIRPVPDFYGADPEEVLDHVRALADDIASVMVVGHNPTMHALAQGLISAEDPDGHDLAVRRGFPTCALGVFTFDVARWGGVGARTGRLAGLFTPPFGEV